MLEAKVSAISVFVLESKRAVALRLFDRATLPSRGFQGWRFGGEIMRHWRLNLLTNGTAAVVKKAQETPEPKSCNTEVMPRRWSVPALRGRLWRMARAFSAYAAVRRLTSQGSSNVLSTQLAYRDAGG